MFFGLGGFNCFFESLDLSSRPGPVELMWINEKKKSHGIKHLRILGIPSHYIEKMMQLSYPLGR